MVKEITTQIREHHPIEKVSLSQGTDEACTLSSSHHSPELTQSWWCLPLQEFVVETRPTGKEHEQTGKATSEVIDSKQRVVAKAQANPCAGVPTAQAQ